MAHYVVEIPGFLPVRLNVLLRSHWAKQRRITKGEAEIIACYVRKANVPRAEGKRRLSVRFESPRTPADADGRLKNLQDGLRDAGALRDDSPKWMALGTIESVKGPARLTIITLEDINA